MVKSTVIQMQACCAPIFPEEHGHIHPALLKASTRYVRPFELESDIDFTAG